MVSNNKWMGEIPIHYICIYFLFRMIYVSLGNLILFVIAIAGGIAVQYLLVKLVLDIQDFIKYKRKKLLKLKL